MLYMRYKVAHISKLAGITADDFSSDKKIYRMTKTFRLTTLIALTLVFQLSFGQKISKKEATAMLEKTVASLKSGDTTAFASLWYLDNTGRPYDNSVFTRKDITEEFNELKVFLDTALATNMKFDYVDVDDFHSFSKYKVKYKVKAWYLYDAKRKYYKGFGVLVDFIDNKWVYRFTFEQSINWRS